MRIAAGADLNILARALRNNKTAIEFDPPAMNKFPAKNAADGVVAKYVQWGAVSGDSGDPEFPDPALERNTIVDINLVKNPGAETNLLGWKKATGTTASSTAAQANSGTKSFTITGHASEDRYIYQDILMRSGELAGFKVSTRGNGTQSAFVRIRNLDTGQNLQSNGTWADASANLGTQAAAAWATLTRIQFNVEDYGDGVTAEGTGKHQTWLRIELHALGAGAIFIDDVELIIAVDGSSIHGVGFPFQMAPQIYSSDTGAFAGEEALRFSMIPFHPSFYSLLTVPVLARYWQFVLPGVREATFRPWMGEWFLVQTVNLEHLPGGNFSSRYGSEIAHAWLEKKAGRAVRALKLPFRWYNEAWPQGREWFILRTLGTQDDGKKTKGKAGKQENRRIWIVAPEFEAQMVIFGKMSGDVGYNLGNPGAADGGITITEDPFPAPPKGEYI